LSCRSNFVRGRGGLLLFDGIVTLVLAAMIWRHGRPASLVVGTLVGISIFSAHHAVDALFPGASAHSVMLSARWRWTAGFWRPLRTDCHSLLRRPCP